jgi:uncharacterized protein (TIGR02996 family)
MSADKSDFLFAICSEPDNLTHRLVYADWLDDVGDDPVRAEYIRLACEDSPNETCLKTGGCWSDYLGRLDFENLCPPCQARRTYKTKGFQFQSIHDSYSEQWKTQSGLGGTIPHDPGNEESLYRCDLYRCEWNNGFVEGVVCNGTWLNFLQDCRTIFRHHPVRGVSIDGIRPQTSRGGDFDYWFSDQFIEDEEEITGTADHYWIPWEVARHFPTANRVEPGYGGQYGIPKLTRHYWTFNTTPNSAAMFLSNQLCRYGFNKAWEDRLRDRPGTSEGTRGSDG